MSAVPDTCMDAVEQALGRHALEPASLIAVLQTLSHEVGYLPEAGLRKIAGRLGVPLADVYHVATFYHAFSLKPKGRHIIKVCMGTACHVRGAPRVQDEIARKLQVAPGETTADGRFTLETVNCLGACALGPVVVVDDRYYRAEPATIDKLLKEISETGTLTTVEPIPEAALENKTDLTRLLNTRVELAVCGGTGCQAYGCQAVAAALENELRRLHIRQHVTFIQSGCHGFCERGPIVIVRPENYFYQKVTVDAVPDIIRKSVLTGEVVESLLYRETAGSAPIAIEAQIPFYAKQQRLIFGDNERISPESIDDYLQRCHGYEALRKALGMLPETIIEDIKRSGLRGRGGGGFPTGRKWETCRNAHGTPKYVICNADEGDPGAYMDRSLLEGNPHRVLEGMIIGAYAIGASQGYVYVRDEYPLAVRNIGLAIRQARDKGFLGKNILRSGFDFDLSVVRGGGAFVCGESTALMASLEGKAGEPRAKYVHTVESGVWGCPSNLNNVETWANVPIILERGADRYAAIGTAGSKGTKIFSLVGKVVNTGLVEVPMGITLRELVFEIGGGIPGGKRFKAVQTGGPSGGCLPESLLDLQIDFDELAKVGSMMGSGGMVVMDETSCMVDVARFFVHFLRAESCGKCLPCREGLARMDDILTGICEGRGRESDVELLKELSVAITDGSLCALGGSAPNPVLSTLRYFEDEYRAHILDRRCPAKTCKALITYRILPDKCTGCTVCAKKCPPRVIAGKRKEPHQIDPSGCIKCGACFDACRFDAIEVI